MAARENFETFVTETPQTSNRHLTPFPSRYLTPFPLAFVLVPDTVEGTYRERQFRMAPDELAKLDIPKMTPDQISELYVDVMIHRDMQFTWLKVNSVLADDLFEFTLIDDPAQFTALCAPAAASNASVQE